MTEPQNFSLPSFDEVQVLRDIEVRNELRRTAHLPLLHHSVELGRAKAAHDQVSFRLVMESPLRGIIQDRLLARIRNRKGDPDWLPSGFLSGGGYMFYVKVRRTMLRFVRRHLSSMLP